MSPCCPSAAEAGLSRTDAAEVAELDLVEVGESQLLPSDARLSNGSCMRIASASAELGSNKHAPLKCLLMRCALRQAQLQVQQLVWLGQPSSAEMGFLNVSQWTDLASCWAWDFAGLMQPT